MQLGIFVDTEIPRKELGRRLYALKVIGKSLGVPAFILRSDRSEEGPTGFDFTIRYGINSNLELRRYDLEIPYEEISEPRLVKHFGDIPVLYSGEGDEPKFFSHGRRMGFDVCARIFQSLSGYGEFHSRETDFLNRHIIPRIVRSFDLHRKAFVNRYIEWLRTRIEEKVGRLGGDPIWKGGSFAVALTHDVDAISRHSIQNTSNRIRDIWYSNSLTGKLRFLASALRSITMTPLKHLRGRDELWTYGKICGSEAKYGLKSTFFLLPPKTSFSHHLDRPYSYDEKMLYEGKWMTFRGVVNVLHGNGWDFGLHAGLESYESASVLLEQKRRLENKVGFPVTSVRQHCLRFKNDSTWRAQEAAELQCDSTYGFNEVEGFRANFCLPFRPYSLREEREIGIWEMPIVIQDNALFSVHGGREVWLKAAVDILKEVKKVQGLATLLWHTNSASEKLHPGWWKTYEDILEWSLREGAVVGSIKELIDWWDYRDRKAHIHCAFDSDRREEEFPFWPNYSLQKRK